MSHSDSELYLKSTPLSTKGKANSNHGVKTQWRTLNESYLSDHSDLSKQFNKLSLSSNSDSNDTPPSRYSSNPNLLSDGAYNQNESQTIKSDPDCCLFVASLMSSKTEKELIESVSNHFNQWGKIVDVKVMKDSMNRPYGFIQYDQRENAELALEKSANTIIDGRHIRVEKARVNRTIFLYHLNTVKTIEQVVYMVSRFGELEDSKILNASDIENKRCGFFKFKYREDAIKAYTNFRARPSIGVEWATFLEKTHRFFDFCSIFIGNLPSNITQNDLENRFKAYGEIVYIHIFPRDYSAFSFIKFKDYTMSVKAIEAENDACIDGNHIKVFFKKINYKQQNKVLNEPNFSPKYYHSPKYSSHFNSYKSTRRSISREPTSNIGQEQSTTGNQGNQNFKPENSQFHGNPNCYNSFSNSHSFQQNNNSYYNTFNRNGKGYNYQKKNSSGGYNDQKGANLPYNQPIMIPYTPYLNSSLANTSQSNLGSPQTPLLYPPYSPYYSPAFSGNNSMESTQYVYSNTHILTQLPDGSYAPMVSYPTEYYVQPNKNAPPQSQVPASPLMLPPPQIQRTSTNNHYLNSSINNKQLSYDHPVTGVNPTSNQDNKFNTSDESMSNARSIYDRKL